MYKALYRKYRPSTFDDMIGQEHIRTVLKRQCESGKTSHAYIFCGTRGTGKTTSAKILAKAVNCLNPVNGEPCGECSACVSIDSGTATDVLELDAASNNSVEDIRRLCDELIYPPASLKKRVYIIDEVHMLSSSAYNALLKTLEEPPENVLFILATTELNKIPPTILSRCQRFEFRRIPAADIAQRLLRVAKSEDIPLTESAAALIARLADGAMRDGFSILESCAEASGGEEIDTAVVAKQLGIAGDDTITKLFDAVSKRNIASCLSIIDEYYASAKSLSLLLDEMLSSVRDMLYIRQGGSVSALMSRLDETELKRLAALFPDEDLIYFASVTEESRNRLSGYGMNKRLVVELALIRMCDAKFSDSSRALASRIAALEAKIALGVTAAPEKRRAEEIKAPETAPEPEKPVSEDTPRTAPTEYALKSELLEQLSREPAVCKLLQRCFVAAKDGKLYVLAGDSFSKDMLKANAGIIRDAAKLTDGTDYRIVIGDRPPEVKQDNTFIAEL